MRRWVALAGKGGKSEDEFDPSQLDRNRARLLDAIAQLGDKYVEALVAQVKQPPVVDYVIHAWERTQSSRGSCERRLLPWQIILVRVGGSRKEVVLAEITHDEVHDQFPSIPRARAATHATTRC